ncbi:MAG TPA: protein translocase subunit SecD [Gaiellaceae bacterium]|nr:protein translocase subunit SecD [Gaiellaceae bacterium]
MLQAEKVPGHTLQSSDLDTAVSIMQQRINGIGVTEPEIRKQLPNQIVIQLAGVHDPQKAAQIIGQTAQLQLHDLENDLKAGVSIDANGNIKQIKTQYGVLAPVQGQVAKGGPVSQWYLFSPKKKLIAGPVFNKDELPKAKKGERIFGLPKGMAIVTCGGPGEPQTVVCPGGSGDPTTRSYYLFDKPPELTGKDLNSGGISQDFDPTSNQPVVRLSFHSHGDSVFQTVTRNLYVRGKLRNAAQHFAIILDGDIKSFPQIDQTDSSLSNGISGGGEITGVTLKEAQDLALVLKYGALPIPFKQVEQTNVSATLGKDSLNEAKTAAIIALLIVALFLIVLYRFLGLVAVAGLAIYAVFLYAAVLLLNVTVTLPGFAGLILTIGVAADANVVIFERIKEEVRSGKSVRAAVATGYQKGFHTIVDANVVTVITALVLFAVATAQVKGFALMLLIGTVISLVTAVVATRAMLGLLSGFRWFANPRFIGAEHAQHGKFLQIDFMGKRRTWFAISGGIILAGVISLAVQGLNLGIDFTGGTQISFVTPKPVSTGQVSQIANQIGRPDAVVQARGNALPKGSSTYAAFQVRMKTITQAQHTKFDELLKAKLGVTQTPDAKIVSSSFSSQVENSAILAIIVSLLLIAAYIALRFDWKYSVPVMVALAHDILITIGVYSISQREVSTATVAAVLTVLGYSIYDTIIIFDRIRENVPIMRRASFANIANVSLWETIRRSLATTFITLLPIGSLLIFGGAELKDFAFALMVGILSGAYSSIFIAAPLLTMFKEREPEYRRRIGTDVIEKGIGSRMAVPAPAAAAVAAVETTEVDGDVDGVEESEPAVAGAPVAPGDGAASRSQQKRERRRQRRSTRPHGRR